VNRRTFLTGSAGLSVLLSGRRVSSAADAPRTNQAVRLKVDTTRVFGTVPADFIGLGYEISSVATPGLLSANNHQYVQLVRTLGPQGVIRVGGNTSDDASFLPDGKSVSAPKGTVVNKGNLHDLASFLSATGWKLIWGLNLGSGNESNAVAEAEAVAAAVKDKLLAFEIGNEPDLFGRGKGAHRKADYNYDDYLKEYRRYKAAIRAKLPDAPFAGPDAASAPDWVARFATDEGRDLKLLTHHYYRECAGPGSTLDKLLHQDPKLAPELQKLQAASESSHVPYRICETNSFCGGGKPGVSDTFGAALWTLDYMFTLASAQAAGVNIETGVNQLGFVSSYSPIGDDQQGKYRARPPYYGMLAFARASQGQRVATSCDASGINLSAYAVSNNQNRLRVTIINKDASRRAAVRITVSGQFANATVLRLTAPSLTSEDDVKLGGSTVTTDADWKPVMIPRLKIRGGECELAVSAGSAAIVTFTP
jgi:Glycosyl hydrolase family 79 C-terminal beta domain